MSWTSSLGNGDGGNVSGLDGFVPATRIPNHDGVALSGEALLTLPNTYSRGQRIKATDIVNFDVGAGTQYGPPTTAPTCALTGGGLTGAYKYVYTETDVYGETTPSPVSAVVNPAGQAVIVTLPLPRKGTSQRRLYRTINGGNFFFFVSALTSGGTGYFQTQFTDNLSDAGLGAAAPTNDGTYRTNLSITNDAVFFIRNTPGSNDASDITILCANPSNGGSFNIDCYGPILSRNRLGHSFQSQITAVGNGAHHFQAYSIADLNPNAQNVPTLTSVLFVTDVGSHVQTPAADVHALDVTLVSGATLNILRGLQSGDTQNRFTIGPSGGLAWGSGSVAPDTSLSRTAAQVLSAGQGFAIGTNGWVGNFLAVGGAVAAGSAPTATVDVAVTSTNSAVLNLRTVTWGSMQLNAAGTSPGDCTIGTTNATVLRLGANGPTMALAIDTNQNLITGPGAKATPAELATTATNGFFYVPTCNGAPTGVPGTTVTGAYPFIYDRSNHKIWVYDVGAAAWKGVVVA